MTLAGHYNTRAPIKAATQNYSPKTLKTLEQRIATNVIHVKYKQKVLYIYFWECDEIKTLWQHIIRWIEIKLIKKQHQI